MELLLIKCGDDYIRVKNGQYLHCGLDKASVYPLEKLPTVREHVATLRREGVAGVCIRKLLLTETAFEAQTSDV